MGPEKGEPVEPHQAAKQGGRSRHEPAASVRSGRCPAEALRRERSRGNTIQGKDISRGVLERGRLEKVRPRNWKSGLPWFSSPGADPGTTLRRAVKDHRGRRKVEGLGASPGIQSRTIVAAGGRAAPAISGPVRRPCVVSWKLSKLSLIRLFSSPTSQTVPESIQTLSQTASPGPGGSAATGLQRHHPRWGGRFVRGSEPRF